MIEILVADDHSLIRRGIAAILSAEADMRIAAEASTGEEALDLARSRHFDVAILDINMPGRGGLEVVREMLGSRPDLKIIILSMYPAEHYAVRSFKDGALAYLTKDKAEAQLAEAIRKVATGLRYVTPEAAERLARYVESGAEQPLHDKLSTRELQILTLIGAGLSVTTIAEKLNLSAKTVSTYRSRVLSKMGLSTSAQLIKYVVDRRLI